MPHKRFQRFELHMDLMYFLIYSILILCLKQKLRNKITTLNQLLKLKFNSLPNDRILDWSKFETFADDKIILTEIRVGESRKHCRKRRKCWLPAFSTFHTMSFKSSLFQRSKKLGFCCKGLKYVS